jgi:hypothetical protein
VNDDYVPQKIYKTFLDLKSFLELCEVEVKIQLDIYKRDQNHFYSDFREISLKVNDYRLQIKNFNSELSIELEKLRTKRHP